MKDIILSLLKLAGKYLMFLFAWYFLKGWCYGEIQFNFEDEVIKVVIYFLLTAIEWKNLKCKKMYEFFLEEIERIRHE